MFSTIIKAFKTKEIRRKILITFAILLVYRIGSYIPVPGVEIATSADFSKMTYLQIMNAVSGGALMYGSFFALGIGPYINASIIMQLLAVGIPALERLSKQGEEGKKKMEAYTRILTIVLAIAQSIGIIVAYSSQGYIKTENIFGASGFGNAMSYVYIVLVYTAGSAVTMWLGERITDHGVSNGISMLIFTGIIATAGQYIVSIFTGEIEYAIWVLILFVVVAVFIFGSLVTVESAERRIPVQYAKQVKGRRMYGGQSTHIPIKVNSGGVMPLIFAYAILSFPDLIFNLCGLTTDNSSFYAWWTEWMGSGGWIYTVLLCVLILFFAYFYNQIQFNPEDISKNIQQNGGFIPGIRPGKSTSDYLKRVSNRITLFGAIFLAIVALVPSIGFKAVETITGTSYGLVNTFSATGLLIVVSVALEFNSALDAQLMMKNYKGFLK